MVILEAKKITKRFGGVIALSDGNITCSSGKITGLLGANGSGKSTLSKIITGVYNADSGEILYNGKSVRYRNPHYARMDGISMVFQTLSLVPDLTVWQNVVLGLEARKGMFLDNAHAKNMASDILAKLMPELDISRKVNELNSGEMQIVEIAKAISCKPKLLILDEPTAALEQTEVKNLFSIMRGLASEGVSMIFTSHRMWEVMEICDDIVVFRNGQSVGRFDFTEDGKQERKIVAMITGEDESQGGQRKAKEPVPASAPTALTVDVKLGRMLRNIQFTLKKGEVLGIGGLAGQGQHVLMLALAGYYANLDGSVTLNGKPLRLRRPSAAVQNGILLVPGDRQLEGLFLRHSIYRNIVFPRLALKRQPLFMPERKYRSRTREIMDILSVAASGIDMEVGKLSGGNQQKVVVGKWLTFDTNVLLLSDPAKGVDVGAKRDLYEFIATLVREKQMSVILYASDTEELVENCNRVLVMYEGQIVDELAGAAMCEDMIVKSSMRISHQDAVASDVEGEVNE